MRTDCLFADFDANKVLDVSSGAEASIINCTFTNNTIVPSDHGAAIIQADAGGGLKDTKVWLPGCKLQNHCTSN